MKDNGYVGLFCLHPLFKEQASHFQGNDVFDINKSYVDYQDIFKNYDLLVTDYSSVFFDFAYLDKPVAYSQFDAKEFFSRHSYEKGYFSYEDDGFGPVSHTLDDAVHDIIGIIQNGCIMDEVYKERVERFYPKDKGHNCKNVYEEILKMP
jgi:CDP-glycerol glycerophosphotransferase (TagB/SpsB family)